MSEDRSPRSLRPLVVTGAAAILILAVLYASNVSSKAAYLTQRNHRILANLGTGVEARINQVAGVFRTVREIEAEDGSVEPAAFDLACITHFGRHEHEATGDATAVPHGPEDHEHDGEASGDVRAEDGGGLHVHAGNDLPEIVNLGGSLELLHRGADGSELHARPDAGCLLGWLGDSEVFDHVALLDGSGRSSYQIGRSGAKFREVPAMAEPAAGAGTVQLPWEDGLREPEVVLAGGTYRVYAYPLTLDFDERAPGGTLGRAEWELVGLVRTDRLWGEALRLHSSILSGLVYALFLAAFSWPFVRLWTLGPNERLRPRLVILACVAMTAGTGLLTVAVVDLSAYHGLQKQVAEELRQTAREIREAFDGELHQALLTARRLEVELADEAAAACDDWIRCSPRKRSPEDRAYCATWDRDAGLHGRLLEERADLAYRHLEMIFWMDPRGNQCSKWAVQARATPLLPVRDRGYFRNVRTGTLWTRPDDPGPGFTLESIHSRNSGATLAVLGLPVLRDGGRDGALQALALALRFPSLLRPVLPPARHAAVIDGTGRVLFHSRPERAGFEDFLREAEDAPELKAVLFAGTDRGLEARYWGRDRQMYATSLPGVPWRLVVYQDKDLLRSLNLEVIASSLALFAVHLLLLGLAAAVLAAIGIGRSGSFFEGRHAGRLLRTATVFSLVAAALALVIAATPSVLLALPALALPLAGLGLAVATLVQGGRGPRLQQAAGVGVALLGLGAFYFWSSSVGAPAALGVAVSVLLGLAFLLAVIAGDLPIHTRRLQALSLAGLGAAALAALAVLPALGLFLAVQEERLDREVHRGQLHLVRSLERRAATIREATLDVPGVRRDLQHLVCDDRDVHYGAYFGTRYRLFAPDDGVATSCGPAPATDRGLRRATHSPGGGRAELQVAPEVRPGTSSGGDGGATAGIVHLPTVLTRTVALHLPVNDHLVQALFAAGGGAWTPSPASPWEADERSIRLDLPGPWQEGEPLSIVSEVPPVVPDRGAETVLAGLGSILLIALGLWLLDRRLLVTGRTGAPPACLEDLRAGIFQRLVVVHPPGADLEGVRPETPLHLNLAKDRDVSALVTLLKDADGAQEGALLCIEGIEAATADPDLRAALWRAADRLGGQTRLRVLLCSATDPAPLLGPQEAASPEAEAGDAAPPLAPLDRFRVEWCADPTSRPAVRRERFDRPLALGSGGSAEGRRGLAGLVARWATWRRLAILRRECQWTRALQDVGLALARRQDFARLDPARIPDLVRREAGDHYHALWRAISPTQRHVLAQLARGALVNPGQRHAAERLAAWNLIVPRPTLRPMNRSFCRFVYEVHDRAELGAWEEAGASLLWRELRLPMIILFAALAAFLVITQRQVFDVAIAVVSAAAAGIPALLRVVDGARKWIGGRMPGGA